MNGDRIADATWRPSYNPWAIAMVVTLATFMEVLDTSIANVALPHIAGNLSVSQDESTWVLTSYLIANAIVLPMSGWLSSLVGRKRFYMSCVALFTVSSFLCGWAPNLGSLIVFRVLQGAGGGGLQPSEQAILADTFPQEKRGMAFAVYGMAVVLAPAVGPTLGGYITDNASWRWIFFINIPVGIASLVLTSMLLEDPPWVRRERGAGIRIDHVGIGLIVLALGCLQYVFDKGEREDWFSSRRITIAAVTSVVGLIALVVWEWFHRHPIIDVRMFQNRNFAIASGMMLMLGVVLFGTTVLLPQYLQVLMGYTAQQAGMVLSPGALLVIFLLPLVGRLLSKVDARWLIGFGFVATALALFHMTNLYPGIDFRTAVEFRMYQSIGLAFLFIPISTISYVGVPIEKNNQVSALINLARNLGGSAGIALATTFILRRAQFHQQRLVGHLSPFENQARQALGGLRTLLAPTSVGLPQATQRAYGVIYRAVLRQASALGYIDTLWVLAVVCSCVAPMVLLLRPNRPGASVAVH